LRLQRGVVEEGAITLPARLFFQLIREITAPEIELQCSTGDIAHILAGGSTFRLNGINKSEFPSLPDLSAAEHFTLSAASLQEMLQKTVFAAAREDSRHVLNGILMQVQESRATFIGTDGKRLAKIFTPIEISDDHKHSYLIPLKAVEEIIKLVEDDQTIKISLNPDKISLELGSAQLTTKLLSGEYPDVERFIPSSCENTFTLHREELMSLLKQVSLFTMERNHSAHFIFTSGELTLSVSSSELGEGKVTMPVDYSGEKLEIAFNPFFFYDILRRSHDETVSFAITDPHNPGLITDSSTAQFVIMPMRLNAAVHA